MRRALAVTGAVAVLMVALGLLAIPLAIRKVAVKQLAGMTGRSVALASVELNLFTARVALNGFSLAQKGSSEPAAEIERLEVRLAPTSLLSDNVRVTELAITRPKFFVTRLSADRYDFSDLLDLSPPPDPNKPPTPPSQTTVTLQHLAIIGGGLIAHDQVPQPAGDWRIEGFDLEAVAIGTRPGQPGTLTVKASVMSRASGLMSLILTARRPTVTNAWG